MNSMRHTSSILKASAVGFALPAGEWILRDIDLTVKNHERIALVGANGSGKTTLLKILSGVLSPTTGSVQASGKIFLLPQLDFSLFNSQRTLLDYLQSQAEDYWKALEIMEQKFGWVEADLERLLASFSGGELVKIIFSLALASGAELLLLDEPTNHLDFKGQQILVELIHGFPGAAIIVSHDAFFIDEVADTVWELDAGKLKVFGGDYTSYKEQKAVMCQAQAAHWEAARKKIRKIRTSLERETNRLVNVERVDRKSKNDRSTSRMARNTMRSQASETAGKNSAKYGRLLERAKDEAAASKPEYRRPVHVVLDFETEGKRKLLSIENGALSVQNKILVSGIEFGLSSGERMSLSGANGSGKSSLIKAMLGLAPREVALAGKIFVVPELTRVYLSQKYEIVDPSLTLAENFRAFNPRLTAQTMRNQLGHFMFMGDTAHERLAAELSGGEVARLALAMLTASPLDILVLDEPTNNLDAETVGVMVQALQDFPGAVITISHNINFLADINVEKSYLIQHGAWKATRHLPAEKNDFLLELLAAE